VEDLLARCAGAGIPIAPPTDPAVHAGEADLQAGATVDEIRASEVPVAARVAGAADEVRLLLIPRLHRWARPHRGGDAWRTPLPPWGMRLARLIRAVRNEVGDRDMHLRWADDGRRCRLISVSLA